MKKYLVVVLMIAVAAIAVSAETVVLEIDKAVDLALENNLGLKSNRLEVDKMKRARDYSWNSLSPSIQASGTLMRWNKEQSGFSFSTFSTYTLPEWAAAAGLDISLNLSYAIIKDIEGTRINYEGGLISYETAVKQLERDIRKNFYNILVVEQNLQLMEQNLQAAKDRYEQAEINYRNGLVPELSVLSAQVGYENMKPALSELRLGYATMLDSFKMLLGIDLQDEVSLTGSLEIEPVKLDTELLTSEFLPNRLDLQSMRNTIKGLENSKSALKLRTLTPMLSLGWNFDPALGGDPWDTDWLDFDNWEQSSGMFRATIAYSIDSLFPWSAAQQGIKDLEVGIKQTEYGLAQARTGAEMEIKSIIMKLNKSMEQLESLQLNVSLAERAYGMSREAYNAGSKELLEVEDSERDLSTARLEVLKEKLNYITGILDLEYALNATIEDIKEVVNE